MLQNEFLLGLEYATTPDLQACLNEAINGQFAFIITPIVHPRFRKLSAKATELCSNITRSDMLLKPRDWTTRIVARLSPHLNVDLPSPAVRQRHEDSMMEELSYCRSLGIIAIMVTLTNLETYNLARVIMTHGRSLNPPLIWAHVPLRNKNRHRRISANIENPSDVGTGSSSDDAVSSVKVWNETWQYWSKFHERLEWSKNVRVVIELTKEIPPAEVVKRWLGEPIKAIIVPTSIFENHNGVPVLSAHHQQLLASFAELHPHVIVSGARRFNVELYANFLVGMWSKLSLNPNEVLLAEAKGWEDSVQLPLQPVSDNIDSQTYGVFEQDPVKYMIYQKAIVKALNFLYLAKMTENVNMPMSEPSDQPNPNVKADSSMQEICITVMVLGAGRGPLVRAAFNASDITNIKIRVVAVEKNPCAIMALAALAREIWYDRDLVTVEGDMRRLTYPEKADIIVSELLGSWGDNELAPECLAGVQGFLKPGGIMIPTEYKSYVAPISSPRLWAAARNADTGDIINQSEKNLETFWVVYMQNKYNIGDTKPVFKFSHPAEPVLDNEGDPKTDFRGMPIIENRKQTTLVWQVHQDSVLHGFAGYFDSCLYEDETISIVPSTHTEDMASWCPIFIPLKTPMRVYRGELMKAIFWRCTDSRRVWYEWIVEVSSRTTALHNVNGSSSDMLL